MTTALVSVALLGLLVFGLGLSVSMMRTRTSVLIGAPEDPRSLLRKLVRAHANAAEYAPMMALLAILSAQFGAPAWAGWAIIAGVASRYLHAAGMVLSTTLEAVQPLRFVGALGTYLSGLSLVIALFLAL